MVTHMNQHGKDEKAREAIDLLLQLMHKEFQLSTHEPGKITPREEQILILQADYMNKIREILKE